MICTGGGGSRPSPKTFAECSMALARRDAMLEDRKSSLSTTVEGCWWWWWDEDCWCDEDEAPMTGLDPLDDDEVDEDDPWWW